MWLHLEARILHMAKYCIVLVTTGQAQWLKVDADGGVGRGVRFRRPRDSETLVTWVSCTMQVQTTTYMGIVCCSSLFPPCLHPLHYRISRSCSAAQRIAA